VSACVGIVAGSGQFPFMVADAAREAGMAVAVAGLHGNGDPALSGRVDAWKEFKLGQLASLIRFFKDNRVSTVVFAGGVNKPRALDIRPDFRAVKLMLRLKGAGDDSILRAVAGEIESEGMTVASPLDLLPALATPRGVLTRREPDEAQWEELRHGWNAAKAMGALDVGQAVAVRSGMILAVEAIEGTDAMISRAGELAHGSFTVVKVAKPGQDLRMDMPAAGLDTIRVMAEAGARCLGLEAGSSVLFDRDAALALAGDKGIAVVGLERGDGFVYEPA